MPYFIPAAVGLVGLAGLRRPHRPDRSAILIVSILLGEQGEMRVFLQHAFSL